MFLALVFGLHFIVFDGSAWAKQRNWGSGGHISSEKPKLLSKIQTKNIVSGIVAKLSKQDFFDKLELPEKFALCNLELVGQDFVANEREFTDMVLNRLMNNSKIIVVNQDLKTDLSMNFQLMHYLPELPTRKKGIYLGANYYIMGELRSQPIIKDNGDVEKHYVVTMVVRDIRSNKTVVKVTEDYSKKGLARKK